ncbi:MAG: hypothetical protein LBN26_03975, partial [Christensenellaceae bacterium]|nr:hypothetical protein [Christensenellaceae bacterium]
MKRTLAIALALVLALSLAACSGGNSGNTGGNNSTTPPANSTTTTPPADTAPNDNGGDTKTVAGYLAQFGLTEDDIKAEGFTSFEGPNGWLIKVNASANQFDTWSKKVY